MLKSFLVVVLFVLSFNVAVSSASSDDTKVEIRVGMTVVRGPDWQYGNQDGKGDDGKLALGTVIEVRKWKSAHDTNLEGNKADEKYFINISHSNSKYYF